jgi:hypothetical protein
MVAVQQAGETVFQQRQALFPPGPVVRVLKEVTGSDLKNQESD